MKHYFVLLLLLIPLASAATMQATYIINDDVTVNLRVYLDNESILIPLPDDVRGITVDDQEVEPLDELILEGKGFGEVQYVTDELLERAGTTFFIADFSSMETNIGVVHVLLPEGAKLVEDLRSETPSIKPRPQKSATDGTRIVFTWNGTQLEPARTVFVEYQQKSSSTWMVDIILILGAIIGILVFWKLRRGAPTDEMTKNLYEDEKRLVEILSGAPEEGLWQKELQRKSGLTKVKTSRKIRSLEAKGVVEKIPYGNTNRIRLKRE